NLVQNAVRHGGNITTLHFMIEKSEGSVSIICEDDGVGMPAEMKIKLFARGFGKDHGLGLFLSREILSITGIKITETGEPERGARFVMTVPKNGFRMVSKDGSIIMTPALSAGIDQ
ncbi:MAG: ATP-binding protein, partial [Euryarchaeota archaeon]|nr:ATP-binding protein [Euryarchaeota archaeon]